MPNLSRLDIRQEIKKLNRMDPREASYSGICKTFTRISHGLLTVVGMAGGGELYFRVRRTGGSKPTKISDLQAPPASLVSGYQRCNPPGVPMFYASSRRIGALVESRVEVDEVVYLSQWIGRSKIPVNKIFDSEENQHVRGLDISNFRGANDDLILTYLDTIFTKRIHSTFSDDYKFTSAIAQQLTSGYKSNVEHDIHSDGCVAIKYPSVFAIENCHNTAMHAGFAKERLELIHVMELKILSIDGNNITIDVLDNAVLFENGELGWSSDRNKVPALLAPQRAVQFRFDGVRWNLELFGGEITENHLSRLMAE
jgi:hypothetical protein